MDNLEKLRRGGRGHRFPVEKTRIYVIKELINEVRKIESDFIENLELKTTIDH